MYRYENVDKDEYEGQMGAESKGRYKRAHIIDVSADYRRG